jgi:hypothetical protein
LIFVEQWVYYSFHKGFHTVVRRIKATEMNVFPNKNSDSNFLMITSNEIRS